MRRCHRPPRLRRRTRSRARPRTPPRVPSRLCPGTQRLRLVSPARAATPAVATAIPTATARSALTWHGWDREGGDHHLGVDHFLECRLAAEVEPATIVDLNGLDHDLVTDVEDLLDALDPAAGAELGDVDQAILVWNDLDECTNGVQDPDDFALVDLAHLDLVGQALDPVDGLAAAALVDRRDEDGAIVFDVDLCAGLLDDLPDHLASWADDVT